MRILSRPSRDRKRKGRLNILNGHYAAATTHILHYDADLHWHTAVHMHCDAVLLLHTHTNTVILCSAVTCRAARRLKFGTSDWDILHVPYICSFHFTVTFSCYDLSFYHYHHQCYLQHSTFKCNLNHNQFENQTVQGTTHSLFISSVDSEIFFDV